MKGRSLLTLLDYTKEEIMKLIDLAIKLKADKKAGIINQPLKGKNIVLIFEKESTRTRCSFEVAASDLGMKTTYLGPTGSQIGKKESIKDTARVLGRIFDGIEYRGYGQEIVETLSKYAGVPVWNGLTNEYHPTQALADILTIIEHRGLAKQKIVYLGNANNNVTHSLMIIAAKLGLELTVTCPKRYNPDGEITEKCQQLNLISGGKLIIEVDPLKATKNADVLYTDVWVSMGEPNEVWDQRIELLKKYQINSEIIKNAKKDVIYMHCLPAFHDLKTKVGLEIYQKYGIKEMEVTDQVHESKHAVVFDQAENRMHTIKAIIYATMI